ncbi:MAG: ankyrin repeat domain-containing protein [Cryomorphaceae bacterium]|nr:ankyrin repeat domain-containing protein [Cryomorphaceae bacterium]
MRFLTHILVLFIVAGCQPKTQFIKDIERGRFDRVKKQVEAGENLNHVYMVHGAPLSIASRKGQYEIAKYLVENGADIHLDCPLTSAVLGGNTKLVGYFIDRGLSPDSLCESHNTLPLNIASRGGNVAMVRFLLERGADPNPDVRFPPLYHAQQKALFEPKEKDVYEKIAQLLIDAGADPQNGYPSAEN